MRVLAACRNCLAQYDVSGQKAGDSLHCRCGGLVIVPEPRIAEARLVRCSSCGASRGAGPNCQFCGARFSTIDQGWGTLCPQCFCRLPNDAQFCVECGVKINPQRLDSVRSDLLCPRCQLALQARTLETIQMYECASCAGMWLPVAAFEAIVEDKETLSVAARGLDGRPNPARFELSAEQAVKYIPCPACKNLMNRRNFAGISGVIIDTCKNCGVWLDNQELNRIVQFIQTGGMDKSRDVEAQARAHSEQMRSKRISPLTDMVVNDPRLRREPDLIIDGVVPALSHVVAALARAFLH
ncbi:MAG TPA: zf-TFIIB domain-containing protein [Planctomycetota bacterium]|jgi:Zn-finger nucleic acid-binding protein